MTVHARRIETPQSSQTANRQLAVRDVGAGATDLDRINERPHSF